MSRPATFSLTKKQIQRLVEATPQGHVAQITLSFHKAETDRTEAHNPADLVKE